MKGYNFILLWGAIVIMMTEVLCAQADAGEVPLGGQIYLENISGDNFGQRVQNAMAILPDQGGIINCRGVRGDQVMDETIILDKPVQLLLGQMELKMDNAENDNMFTIASSGVEILGLGRSVKSTLRTGKTVLIMKNGAGNELYGYHFYNRGHSCVSVKNLDLIGVQTTMGHQYLSSEKPMNGSGGIYMERPSPGGAAQSGNNISQIILENIYIEKTKAHGIYLDTPILSTVSNVRISDAGGHGLLVYRGTSCGIESLYVSSANYAGVVLFQHAYATVQNSVVEGCGMGWWIRSSRNITLLSPGVEETKNIGLPWGIQAPYGLNLKTTTEKDVVVDIKDVNADVSREFVGHGYYVSGGESISIVGLYCKDPGSAKQTDDAFKSNKTRFLKVTAANKNSSYSGLSLRLSSSCSLINDYDVEIGQEVMNCRLEWDPEASGLVVPTVSGQYISSNKANKAPLLLRSSSTLVISGNKVFTPYDNR